MLDSLKLACRFLDRRECSEKTQQPHPVHGAGDYSWVEIYQGTPAQTAMTSPLVSTE